MLEVNYDDLEYHEEYDDEGCSGSIDDGNWEWTDQFPPGIEIVGKRKKRKQP